MSSNARIILHIVYIHGFQGDHTTFQSFPTDLHHALQPKIPSHIELRSILYPTYKTKRPIAVATEKFLQWLETLPSGPVIVCGHSMGGLLAAEAATSSLHVSKRVFALIAFDVPFLGMHPHVVISGIASLLPHQKREKEGRGNVKEGLKTEKEMNDASHVDVSPVTQSSSPSPNASHTALSPPAPMAPSSPATPSLTPPPLPPRPSSARLTSSSDTQLAMSSHTPAVISRTLDFLQSHADDRLVNFIAKHRSDPIAAARRWVVESLEFGICMFDPKGLRDRYAALERWHGTWVAFWTETVSCESERGEMRTTENVELEGDEERVSREEREVTTSFATHLEDASPPSSETARHSLSTASSFERNVAGAVSGPLTKSEDKAIKKQAKVDKRKRDKESASLAKADRSRQEEAELKALSKQRTSHSPHHFVVRPFREPSGLKHRWEQVKIRGAKDEVEAHCGLFIRDINLDYDNFVRRVADIAKGWVDGLVP